MFMYNKGLCVSVFAALGVAGIGEAGLSWWRGELFVSLASCLTSWLGVLFLDDTHTHTHQTQCPSTIRCGT